MKQVDAARAQRSSPPQDRNEVRFFVGSGSLAVGDPRHLTDTSFERRGTVQTLDAQSGFWFATVTRLTEADDDGASTERIATLTVRHESVQLDDLDLLETQKTIVCDSGLVGLFDLHGLGEAGHAGSFADDVCAPATDRAGGFTTLEHSVVCRSGAGTYRLDLPQNSSSVDALRIVFRGPRPAPIRKDDPRVSVHRVMDGSSTNREQLLGDFIRSCCLLLDLPTPSDYKLSRGERVLAEMARDYELRLEAANFRAVWSQKYEILEGKRTEENGAVWQRTFGQAKPGS